MPSNVVHVHSAGLSKALDDEIVLCVLKGDADPDCLEFSGRDRDLTQMASSEVVICDLTSGAEAEFLRGEELLWQEQGLIAIFNILHRKQVICDACTFLGVFETQHYN